MNDTHQEIVIFECPGFPREHLRPLIAFFPPIPSFLQNQKTPSMPKKPQDPRENSSNPIDPTAQQQ